jgi:hypothetical protein
MYYVAIVLDMVLRFAWIWYLAPSPSVPLRGFLLALLEVFRRIVWNGFRVESEHIGNVDVRLQPCPLLPPGLRREN